MSSFYFITVDFKNNIKMKYKLNEHDQNINYWWKW